jgi:hypothetical protein
MTPMKKIFTVFSFLLLLVEAKAQSDSDSRIPIGRLSRHEDIKAEQINCDKLDGKLDGLLREGSNESTNAQVTDALYRKSNELRNWVEVNDKIVSNNDKVRYLKAIADLLIYFRNNKRERQIKIAELPDLMETADKIMKAKVVGKSVLPFIEEASYPVGKICNLVLVEGDEKSEATRIVYLKFTTANPDKILQTIAPYAGEPYADSLLVVACKANPEKFYTYAQSPNSAVGKLIFKNKDRLVMKVAQLSQTPNALLYFPFLDDILSERQTIDSIKKYVGDGEKGYDSVGYYKLLVSTAIAYSKRMMAPLKDTPIAYFGANGFIETLRKKGSQHFISHINNLHDLSNLAIRMKAIQPLAPKELYYMIVLGESEIYTSSYKHSFARMLQLMGAKPRGDSLMLSVNFDFFRKFIKMAANYNKLDTFLKMMPKERSEMIMTGFVSNLESVPLEASVDVADAYSSVTNKSLQKSMLDNVKNFETKAIENNNKKGKVVYGLLKTIFLSLKDSTINLTKEIGIPPIFDVANKYVQDGKGKIIEQVFFYGDKDGKDFFPRFRNTFSAKDWKITDKKEWIEAASLKGNIVLYANKPLDSDANQDDTAQVHLGKYLIEQGLTPSVIVHRGHSYWLNRTMDRMPGDAKIVLLGSCGGYQNLNKILEINPDAHIISTKEIGAGDINTPILNTINGAFMNGTDLSWRKMWDTLTKSFAKDPSKAIRDSWENYIPPYKNLGAIFLKAYSLKMNEE